MASPLNDLGFRRFNEAPANSPGIADHGTLVAGLMEQLQ